MRISDVPVLTTTRRKPKSKLKNNCISRFGGIIVVVGLLNIVLVLFFILTIQPNETSLLTITSRGSPKKIVPKYLSKAARESVVQSLPLKTFAAAGAGKEDETVLPEPDVIRAEFKITGTATTSRAIPSNSTSSWWPQITRCWAATRIG